jgi:hypothetical protein
LLWFLEYLIASLDTYTRRPKILDYRAFSPLPSKVPYSKISMVEFALSLLLKDLAIVVSD